MPTMFATAGAPEGFGIEVSLPALPLRDVGLFTQVVPMIDTMFAGADRLGFGAKWLQRDALHTAVTTIADVCDPDSVIDVDEIDVSVGSTLPFGFNQSLRCSTIGGLDQVEINAMLDSDEEATRSEALTRALTTSLGGDHLNFVDDSTAVAGGTMQEAMGAIEQGLGQRISNLRGYIFVPLTLLGAARSSGGVRLLDGYLVSPAGHLVVADAGHESQNTIYGTGAIGYAVSAPIQVMGGGFQLNRNTNVLTGVRARYGVIAFNPEHTVRSTVS